MPSLFKNWDIGNIILAFGGVQIQGFAPGTVIKVARTTDSFKSVAGANGDVVRSRSRDRRGTVTVTLLASSPSNDYLSTVHAADVASGAGDKPLMLKDLNGSTLIADEHAWIMRPADSEFSEDQPNREWTFDCANLDMFIGGSLV